MFPWDVKHAIQLRDSPWILFGLALEKRQIFSHFFFHWIPGPAPRPVMKCFLSPMNHQFLLFGAGFAVLVAAVVQVGSKLHHSGGDVCVVQCRVWCGLS